MMCKCNCELVSRDNPTCPKHGHQRVPHKHAALIKAWADGAKIECNNSNGEGWKDISSPYWSNHCDYRIKPEPKPDRFTFGKAGVFGLRWDNIRVYDSNVMFTFDGETSVLKQVELIK